MEEQIDEQATNEDGSYAFRQQIILILIQFFGRSHARTLCQHLNQDLMYTIATRRMTNIFYQNITSTISISSTSSHRCL